MRAAALALLVLLPALAGCAVPSGVNDDAYAARPQPPGAHVADMRGPPFISAMITASVPRAPIPDEDAYDRYLENATRWALEGLDDADAARPFNASAPEARAALATLEALANATRGSDKEVLAGAPVRLALSLRYGLSDRDGPNATEAEALVDAARDAVARANASVHAARANATPAGRNALLRAEAVLGLALTQAASAEASLATPGRALAAATSALDARVNARAVQFWLDEATAAGGEGRLVIPADLPARTARTLAQAEAALDRARRSDDPTAQPALSDLALGLGLVNALQAAGLPEGAWAASQGLTENLLVLDLVLADDVPTEDDVLAAWRDARANVRTFRDAQRYDRALAGVDEGRAPFGGDALLLEHLRAYAAVKLMREISAERESAFGA